MMLNEPAGAGAGWPGNATPYWLQPHLAGEWIERGGGISGSVSGDRKSASRAVIEYPHYHGGIGHAAAGAADQRLDAERDGIGALRIHRLAAPDGRAVVKEVQRGRGAADRAGRVAGGHGVGGARGRAGNRQGRPGLAGHQAAALVPLVGQRRGPVGGGIERGAAAHAHGNVGGRNRNQGRRHNDRERAGCAAHLNVAVGDLAGVGASVQTIRVVDGQGRGPGTCGMARLQQVGPIELPLVGEGRIAAGLDGHGDRCALIHGLAGDRLERDGRTVSVCEGLRRRHGVSIRVVHDDIHRAGRGRRRGRGDKIYGINGHGRGRQGAEHDRRAGFKAGADDVDARASTNRAGIGADRGDGGFRTDGLYDQRAIVVMERVIGRVEGSAGGGTRNYGVRRARDQSGGRGARAGERHRTDGFAVLKTRRRELRAGEGHRLAIIFGAVVGGDVKRGRANGERSVQVGNVVVRRTGSGSGAGHDGVRTDARGRGGARTAQGYARDGVAVEQTLNAESRCAEVGNLAVKFGLVVGRKGERGRADRQRARRVNDGVVWRHRAADGDREGARVAGAGRDRGNHGRRRNRGPGGVSVNETAVITGKSRHGAAISHGRIIRRNGEDGQIHRQGGRSAGHHVRQVADHD